MNGEINIVDFTDWFMVFVIIPILIYGLYRCNKNIMFLRRKIEIMKNELRSHDLETSNPNIESALELVDQFCNDNEVTRLKSICIVEKEDEDGYIISLTF